MIKTKLHAFLIAALLIGAGRSYAEPTAPPATAKIEQEKATQSPRTLLFLGDSITAQGGYIRKIDTALKADGKTPPIKVIGAGRPSETLSGLSEINHPGPRPCLFTRLDNILLKEKPDWVVACYGMNDGIYHPFDEKRFEAYKQGVEALIQKIHGIGCPLILMTPPPFAKQGPPPPESLVKAGVDKFFSDANEKAIAEIASNPARFGYRSPYDYYDKVLEKYSAWLLTLKGRKNVWVINLRDPLVPHNKEAHGGDPIHPNAIGHKIMADAFLAEWPAILPELLALKKTQ